MNREALSLIAILFLVFGAVILDSKRIVSVTICEINGNTSYVNKYKPTDGLSFGTCQFDQKMTNERYWQMRNDMRHSNGSGK